MRSDQRELNYGILKHLKNIINDCLLYLIHYTYTHYGYFDQVSRDKLTFQFYYRKFNFIFKLLTHMRKAICFLAEQAY